MLLLTVTVAFLLCGNVTASTEPVEAEVERLIAALGDAEEEGDYEVVQRLGELGPAAAKAIPALEALEGRGNLGAWAFAARCKIGPGPLPFPHNIAHVRLAVEADQKPDLHQYVLQVTGTGQAFNLGQVSGDPDNRHSLGFDPESLLLQWLEQDRVLLAHWTTRSQGSGHHQGQGNLILVKSNGLWQEALRHCAFYRSRGGGSDSSQTFFEFHWSAYRQELEVVERNFTLEPTDTSAPLAKCWTGDSGGEFCARAYSFVRAWKGRLKNGQFLFATGSRYFAPAEEHPGTIGEVAEFLQMPQEDLLDAAANLTPDSPCPKRILVEQEIPPLQPDPQDIFHTGL